MRTIVDAVNAMRGDWSTGSDCLRDPDVLYFSRNFGDGGKLWVELTFTDSSLVNVRRIDFDQCVKEMSEGKFVSEANKMKTVTDKDGNVYEIGKVYEFGDGGSGGRWVVGKLTGVGLFDAFKFESDIGVHFKYCRESQAENGAITKAPVELVDGGVYELELNNSKYIGYFDKNRHSFFNSIAPKRNKICGAIEPKGITRLVPEAKQ